jgi:Flp pilus assembly protein protease CpaA
MIDNIIYTVCLGGLIIASITDLKTREVPDWLNFSMIASGLGLNLLFSVLLTDYRYIINSIVGLLAFFIIALIMFYTGQWGGGDSKMIMGLGALIGIDLGLKDFTLLSFLINSMIVGAVYGLVWTFVLAVRKRKQMIKELKKINKDKNIVRAKKLIFLLVIVLLVGALLRRDPTIRFLLLSLLVLAVVTFYLWIYIKAIEKSAMLKYVIPSKLTEGEWIAEDIVVNKKRICGPKDLGISKEQISKLVRLYNQKKVKKILIKEGIPFVPSFLIAFIVTLTVGNVLLLLVA